MTRRARRCSAAVAASAVVLTLGSPAALAPPVLAQPAPTPTPSPSYTTPAPPDPLITPTALPIAPDAPTVRTNVACVQAAPGTAGSTIAAVPWGQSQLRFEDAWALSTGAGVPVAVIDTGVNAHPRLAGRLAPGGDYVSDSQGLTDCDGHGTIVAGIIAASVDTTEQTGFAGVAPGATIISIRQSSKYYETVGQQGSGTVGYGNLNTLARSVTRAVELGARVINISEAACAPANVRLQDSALGAALRQAADRDVVVVAAAGNTGAGSAGACQTQNSTSPSQPGVAGRSAVATIVSPAWYSDSVLTVGAVAEDGSPSDFSLAGPWVGVAGPGEDITSLDPAPGATGLTNRLAEPPGLKLAPIQGTSFAVPYVAGTAALVRARFPNLSAKQVVARIKATARTPSGGWTPQVGHGVVDPVAAVADVLPEEVSAQSASTSTTQLSAPPPAPAPDHTARTVAFVGSATALALVLITFAVLDAVRRHRRNQQPD